MIASIGVISALLAAQGITGPENVVEGPHGFQAAIAHSLDYEKLLAPAAEYRLMETNTKWFNTVRQGQTAVESVFSIMDKLGLAWSDIEFDRAPRASERIQHARRPLGQPIPIASDHARQR